jgi:ankyrin repeat protein
LLEAKADVNARDNSSGITVLWIAAWQGEVEVVKLLLEKGADVNAKRSGGETALEIAKAMEHTEIVQLLEKAGAKELLPHFKGVLQGTNPVSVRNPNDFAVSTGLRSGERGINFDVSANGAQTVYVPNGTYDIFFVYSDKPDALFQGDSFTLNNNGVEIQIVQIVNGNYNIKQVK